MKERMHALRGKWGLGGNAVDQISLKGISWSLRYSNWLGSSRMEKFEECT